MIDKIKVSEEVYTFFIPGNKEWLPVVSHKISIDDLDYMFLPEKRKFFITLNVYEVLSGSKITEFKVDPFDFLGCNTKEKTLQLFFEKAIEWQKIVREIGQDKLIEALAERKFEFERKLGPMPASELYGGNLDEYTANH